MRRYLLPVLCAAALASCSSDPVATSQLQVTTINIYDFYYSPTATTVRTGTRVEWVNHGPSAHTATSDDGVWDSGTISPPSGGGGTPPPTNPPPTNPPPPYPYAHSMAATASSFATTFNTPGVYGFHCSLHPPATNPSFVGTITVTE